MLSGLDPAETEKIWILDSKHWNSSLATGSGRAEKNDDIASPEEPPLLLTGKKSVWWGEGLGGTTVYTVLPKYMTLPLRARNRGIEHQNKQILYRHSWCSTLKKKAFVVVNIWILLYEATPVVAMDTSFLAVPTSWNCTELLIFSWKVRSWGKRVMHRAGNTPKENTAVTLKKIPWFLHHQS